MRVTNKCAAPTDPNAAVDLTKAATGRSSRRTTAPGSRLRSRPMPRTSGPGSRSPLRSGTTPRGSNIQTGSDSTKDWTWDARETRRPRLRPTAAWRWRATAATGAPRSASRGSRGREPGDPTSWKRTGDPAGRPRTSSTAPVPVGSCRTGTSVLSPSTRRGHALVVAFNGTRARWVAGPGCEHQPPGGHRHVFISRRQASPERHLAEPAGPAAQQRQGAAQRCPGRGSDLASSTRRAPRPGSLAPARRSRLPLTVVADLEVEPNGDLYAADVRPRHLEDRRRDRRGDTGGRWQHPLGRRVAG